LITRLFSIVLQKHLQEIMTKKIQYEEIRKFKKDLKKLLKKFPTLNEDLELAKIAAIELYHLRGIDNLSIFPIRGACTDSIKMCKVKKFACKSLKGKGAKSGIRIIYAFHIQELKVTFIEIYFKGDKESEDKERIKEYLKFYENHQP